VASDPIVISTSGCGTYAGAMTPEPQNVLASAAIERALSLVRVDFKPASTQPSWARLGIATVVSLIGSLIADAALVAVGTRIFPSTIGYGHFQWQSYTKLTVIGVIIACLAWPIVTRISSDPRWLFFRMAIVVTLVLLLPDAWILMRSAPTRAVLVLVVMHVAIAVVTYTALVRIAPAGNPEVLEGG
jgi:hypothetical protein